MPPKIYEKYFIQFDKLLSSKENNLEINSVRQYSVEFATSIRGSYDLYARKYHAYLFSEWCDRNKIPYPEGWDKEAYWPGNFR